MKKMLLTLEESTFKALGHLAVERGTSKSALVRAFIEAGLRGAQPAPKLAPPSFVQADDRMYKALAGE